MKNDNPYKWSFDEYKAWHDGIVKKANSRSVKESNVSFISDVDVMDFLRAVPLDEYIKKLHEL